MPHILQNDGFIPPLHARAGFTLPEILIALGILVVIATSSSLIFRSASRAWQRGELVASKYQRARTVLDYLSRSLASACLPQGSKAYLLGSNSSIFFINASLSEMGYWLRENDLTIMQRYQQPADFIYDQKDPNYELAHGINKLQFQYSDGTLWKEDWDSRVNGRLPTAVKVTISIEDEKTKNKESFETIVYLPASL